MKTKVFNFVMLVLISLTVSTAEAAPRNSYRSQTVRRGEPARGIVVPPSRVTYRRPTPTVKATFRLPSTSVVVSNRGVNLHYNNGRYYRRDANRYIAVAPPRGFRVKVLPVGYRRVVLMGVPYYYHHGVYYKPSGREYEVVNAPQDIIVSTLPEETELMTYEGKDYYIYNRDIYSVVITPNGRAFKKVGELEY